MAVRAAAADPGARRPWRAARRLAGPAVLLAATLAMFGDVLLAGDARLLSLDGEDMGIFHAWCRFGFGEMARGNLPLWNPHIFSGGPFLGGFQPALLYPPNWVHLILPVATAINLVIALHVFLAGLFVYLWAGVRRLAPAAAVLAGLVFMFSGAYFLQLYRGHLANLCTIVWAPLILLAIDALVATGLGGWALVGMAAVAMQILAGHVQYVFYTAIVAGVLALAAGTARGRLRRALAGFGAIYLGGASLAAVQILPGLAAVSESLRADLGYEVARTFAFPPENLLTAIVPGIFGDMVTTPYWGRWTLSEMSLFIGVAPAALAVCGVVLGVSRSERRVLLATAGAALTLAMGYYTPLYRVLYEVVPGFGSFRGVAKFAVLATPLLALLVGAGLDALLRLPAVPRWPAVTVLVTAAALLSAGAVVLWSAAGGAAGAWGRLLASIDVTGEAWRYFPVDRSGDFVAIAGQGAGRALLAAGATALVVGGLLMLARSSRRALYLLALVGGLELFAYARSVRPWFDPRPIAVRSEGLRTALAGVEPGRVTSRNPYLALEAGADDVWGYDPMILRRYAEFIGASQGLEPRRLMVTGPLDQAAPRLGMLRLRYAFRIEGEYGRLYDLGLDALPRALLVSRWQVVADPEARLATIMDPGFDPRALVLLEAPPDPAPAASPPDGQVSVVDVSSDVVGVRAELAAPALLVMTDNYSVGWRVRSLDPDPPQRYALMPADHTLRAIPLAAGAHHLRLEYRPPAFAIGAAVTAIAILLLGAACVQTYRRPCVWSFGTVH